MIFLVHYTNPITMRAGKNKVKASDKEEAKIIFENRYPNYLIDYVVEKV